MKAKSSLVSRRFKQRGAIDFREAYISTISRSCLRLLNAVACEFDLNLCHFDVSENFIQPKLDVDIFGTC